jgi:hypothetical protein
MKLSVWNILAVFTLLAAAGVSFIYFLIFINPHIVFNPFPPPTPTVYIEIPTATPTLRQLPATWTTTPEANQKVPGSSPRPSSTFRATRTPLSLFTFTPSQAVSGTPTPTRTRTRTVTSLPITTYSGPYDIWTSTYTPTNKPTANATKTMAVKMTRTATYAPPNPVAATETNYSMPSYTSINKKCTRSYNSPAFTWDAVPGATGYYLFWGVDSGGTSTNSQAYNYYSPSPIGSGIYNLRVKTLFNWGERPNWTTIFSYCYDSDAPNNPAQIKVTGVSSEVWTNVPDPSFFWLGATDVGSGVKGYYFYWGLNEAGSCSQYQTGTDFTPPVVSSTSKYYLRIRTEDWVGNLSSCQTVFQYWFDETNPTDPGTPAEEDSPTGKINFAWTPSSDANSGLSGYEVNFSKEGDSTGSITTTVETNSWTSPSLTEAGTYNLSVRSVDEAGNKSSWITGSYSYTP